MKFREIRGGLQESLETQVNIRASDSLYVHVKYLLSDCMEISRDDILIRYYGYEPRTLEELHSVIVNGYGIIGYLSGF